jgi:two-component system nitrogen regulation response regulator NtrX
MVVTSTDKGPAIIEAFERDAQTKLPMTRILLVEDDDDVRLALEDLLVDEGYAVTAVASVNEATAFLDAASFDLVLTDGSLPDGTGIEIADKAVERGALVLILTGYASHFPEEKLRRFDYFVKPIRIALLKEAIERSLIRRRLE